MQTALTITDDLMSNLYDNTILLKYNSPRPTNGTYGWLKEGTKITLHHEVTIEQNVGIYGGPYKPMVGGRKTSGFATVGAFTYSYSALPDGLQVGRYSSISAGLQFIDSSHPLAVLTTSALTFRPKNNLFKDFMTPGTIEHAAGYSTTGKNYPEIGHDVWIGANVTLSMGIKIGTGAVLASNSTVTKDVPPYAIVGGNPAKIIKYRFEPALIEELLGSQWWNFDPMQVFHEVDQDFTQLLKLIKHGDLNSFEFRKIHLNGAS